MKTLRLIRQHDLLREPCGWVIVLVEGEAKTPLIEADDLTAGLEAARELKRDVRVTGIEVKA